MSKQASASDSLLDPAALKNAGMVYRATNNKLRQKIIRLIHQKGKVIVTHIYKKLRIEQSVASQHLAILRQQGIVQTEREGKFIYYSVNQKRLEQLHAIAESLGNIEK